MALLNWTDYPRFWLSALPPASEHYDMVILANDDDKPYRSDGSAWVPYSPQTSFGLVPPTAYLNEGVALVSEASSLNVIGVNLNLTAAGNALTLTAEGPQILNAGNPLVPTPTSLNFTGTGISASADGTAVTVTSNGNPIQILDDGSLLTSNLTSLNFTGGGVTATASGSSATISVPSISPDLAVLDDGTTLTASASSLNFVGEAVTATSSGSQVTISISGSGTLGSAPPACCFHQLLRHGYFHLSLRPHTRRCLECQWGCRSCNGRCPTSFLHYPSGYRGDRSIWGQFRLRQERPRS